jgi:hypothetical protein
LAIAQKPGSSAIDIANAIEQKLRELDGVLIPDQIHYYGKTADEKHKRSFRNWYL